MSGKLTKGDLYFVTEHLASLRPPGPRALTAEQLVRLDSVLEKLTGLVQTMRTRTERGQKILEWRLNCEIAPTQNELNGWYSRNRFRIGKTKDILRAQIQSLVAAHPEAALHGAQKRRWLRVTRFTSAPKRVDEDRIDAIGGKLPVDMLKHCEIIVDDSKAWLERRAHVMRTHRGNTHVLIELFDTAEIEVPHPGPVDGPAPSDPRSLGKLTRAIVGEQPIGRRRKTQV